MAEEKYGFGNTKQLIYDKLVELQEEYPTSDKGKIVFAKEVLEVLADMLEGDSAKIC